MQPYSIAPIVMASFSFAAALPELLLWARRKRRPEGPPFAAACLAVSLYCIACAGLYNTGSTASSLPWSRFQAAAFCLVGISFLWFLSTYTGTFPKTALRILVAAYALGIAAQILDLGNLTWLADQPRVKHVSLPFGYSFEIKEVRNGPLTDSLLVSGFFTMILGIRSLFVYLRSGHRRDALRLGLASGLVIVAFAADFLVTHGLLHIPYTFEYSWLGFILLMYGQRGRQLEESKEAKLARVENDIKFRTIVEESLDVIAVCDAVGRTLFLSPSFGPVFGSPPEPFIGRNLAELIHPDDLRFAVLDTDALRRAGGRSIDCFRARRADGEWITIESIVSSFDLATPQGGILISARDITERRKAEEAILASLKEKELLLQEIHHRVNNNLQIISSLLSFQAKKNDDAKIKTMVEDSRNQILAMSAVYEALYRQPDLVRIDFGSCVIKIVERLLASRQGGRDISLKTRLDEVVLGIDVAIPAALIVNELVANALKHAFPAAEEGREAELRVELGRGDRGRVSLLVADNGVGSPEEAEAPFSGHGLQIVSILARQIGGEVTIDRKEGLSARIDFAPDRT